MNTVALSENDLKNIFPCQELDPANHYMAKLLTWNVFFYYLPLILLASNFTKLIESI